MLPQVGLSVPQIICSKVDLPLPLHPMIPTVSPFLISNETSLSAQNSRKYRLGVCLNSLCNRGATHNLRNQKSRAITGMKSPWFGWPFETIHIAKVLSFSTRISRIASMPSPWVYFLVFSIALIIPDRSSIYAQVMVR
jgi:hypothetical protein